MGRVIRTGRAEQDLLDIWRYIARDNYQAADRFLDKLDQAFQTLSSSPKMGRNRSKDSLVPGLRSFPVEHYVILYRELNEADGVVVIRVIHAARDIETFLSD